MEEKAVNENVVGYKGWENLDIPLLIIVIISWFSSLPAIYLIILCLAVNFVEFKYYKINKGRKKSIMAILSIFIIIWNTYVIISGTYRIIDTISRTPEAINYIFTIR